MTMILDASTAHRPEQDYVKITQISAVGSLADTVLRELISVEVGDAGNPLVAIPRAARFFRVASSGLGQPRSIWATPTVADELFHFSASAAQYPAEQGAASADVRPWFESVATALENVAGAHPSREAIDTVRQEFTQIAAQTMRLATNLVESHHRV